MWPLPDRRIADREFERLLVRVPNWLGDQILATPALSAVRARYPRAHVTGHGSENARLLYEGGPWFDDFLVTSRREGPLAQARAVRRGSYDACLLLTGSFRTALVPFLARVPHRIGYRWSGRTPLLTAHWRRPRPGGKKAPYPTKLYFLDLVAKLGARGEGRVTLPLTEEARRKGEAWLSAHGIGASDRVLAMCVGAAFGPSKLWPAEYFAKVADAMQERRGLKVVVLCAPGEEEIGARVRSFARRPLVDTGLAPLTIDVLKAVIARAAVLLTNDTGPRHIAASFRVPIVCLMGPTDPTYTDTDVEDTVVLREPVECSPCHLKVCPIDHRCMERLPPERAIAAVEAKLAERG
jgi:heptosyltransferase-2